MADEKTERAQKRFHQHLKMHPGAHKAALSFAQKLLDRDAAAIAMLRDLSAKAATDESAANAVRIVAITMKFDKKKLRPPSTMVAGGLPAVGGKVLKAALTPAAWVLSSTGHLFRWVGGQFQHVSQVI